MSDINKLHKKIIVLKQFNDFNEVSKKILQYKNYSLEHEIIHKNKIVCTVICNILFYNDIVNFNMQGIINLIDKKQQFSFVAECNDNTLSINISNMNNKVIKISNKLQQNIAKYIIQTYFDLLKNLIQQSKNNMVI